MPAASSAHRYDGEAAGLVSRGAAMVIDGVIIAVLLTGLWLTTAAARLVLDPVNFSWPTPSRPLSVALVFLVAISYLTLSWLHGGATLGALVLGLRLVHNSGRPLRPVRAFVRAVLCVVFPIGLVWSAVSRRHLSLQDILVGTVVVYDWNPVA